MSVTFENETTGRKLTVEDHDAARVFLELHGGGMNEDQTARAMEDQRAVLDGEPVNIGDVYCYAE